MRVNYLHMVYLVLMTLGSCVDPISFETASETGQLVLYGNFSQLEETHLFTISRTADFDRPAIPVSGALLTLKDDLGNSAVYQEIDQGNYQLNAGALQGEPGRSYHIEVNLENGKSYFSRPQLMPEPIEIDSIYYEFVKREEFSDSGIPVDKTLIEVFIDTPLKDICGEPSHIRWTVEEVYSFVDRICGTFDIAETCYYIDPVDNSQVLVFQNEGNSREFLKRYRVRSRLLVPYDEFTARHYFIIRQYSIDDEALDYWTKIDAVANQSGNLFDVQPAKVVGNLYNLENENELVLGYFGVHGQSSLRTFTTPFDIRPNPVFTCNDESFFNNNPSICCFCSNKEGIRIERPDYWDED